MRRTREPLSRLREFVDGCDPIEGVFPLVHTTDAYRFSNLLRSKTLIPTTCDIFNERILYMFLSRPAYRTRQQTNDRLHFDLPIVIFLKPIAAETSPIRIFPFDTGAFERDLYRRFFHKDTEVMDFDLGSDVEVAKKYIGIFYRDFRDYFIGSTSKNVDIPFGIFEAEGLHELARAPADPNADSRIAPDERSSSVELQFIEPISLPGNTMAIILPQQLLDQQDIRDQIEEIYPDHLETYLVISKSGSREIAGAIYEITRKIYTLEGVM